MGLLGQTLGRAQARLTGSTSITKCSSFGCSTYTLELTEVKNNGDGTVTVTWTRNRQGDGLIGEVTIDILVAGQRIGGETTTPASNEVSESVTGSGSVGDAVTARLTTWDDESREVTATVPSPPDGGNGGGNGDDGGNGGTTEPPKRRRTTLTAGAFALGSVAGPLASRLRR